MYEELRHRLDIVHVEITKRDPRIVSALFDAFDSQNSQR